MNTPLTPAVRKIQVVFQSGRAVVFSPSNNSFDFDLRSLKSQYPGATVSEYLGK